MELLSVETAILFAILVLPGFVSIRVFELLNPSDRRTAADAFFEALSFGLINAFVFLPMRLFIDIPFMENHPGWMYILAVIALLIAPAIWAVLWYYGLDWLANRGAILGRHRTAFDAYFTRRNPCWVIVHLPQGDRVGGRFGDKSYATFYPRSGHLYLEEMWELDEKGAFKRAIPGSGGMVFRPGDYKLIEVVKDAEE